MSYTPIETLPEFDDHALFITAIDHASGLKAYIAIHRGGIKNPAFGATRMWHYPTDSSAIAEALKLSRIMSYKSALAGFKYGGAKAIIVLPKNGADRSSLLTTYARRVNYFRGSFITGADVGVSPDDLRLMRKQTKYMVGFRSDPVAYTMLGVFYGIQISLKEVFGSSALTNRTFAVQGLGKTGTDLLKLIYPHAKKIFVTDINKARMASIKQDFPLVEPVDPADIMSQEVDVFSPCALGGILNTETIKHLRARVIAGSANSQLENVEAGNQLYKKGILYAPDYVINAGGLMAVVDEYEHKNKDDNRVERKVATIKHTLSEILATSKRTHTPPHVVADTMAQAIAKTFV